MNTQHTYTDQQETIFSAFLENYQAFAEDNTSPKTMLIKAAAGTGKTSTVIAIAEKNPSLSFYMLCFARANAEELNNRGRAKGIHNLNAVTTHKLAYDWWIKNHRADLIKPFLPVEWIEQTYLTAVPNSKDLAWKTLAALKDYFSSTYESFESFWEDRGAEFSTLVASACRNYIQDMADANNKTPVTLDAVLHFYQKNAPSAFHKEAIIFVEEYQDINDVQTAFILAQPNFIVAIGDPNQAIYSWRKGGYLSRVAEEQGWPSYPLTNSFRVNPESASLANMILNVLGGEPMEGLSAKTEVQTKAFLYRTNASVLHKSFDLIEEGIKHTLFLDLTKAWDDLWWISDRLAGKPILKKSKSSFTSLKNRADVLQAATYLPEVSSCLSLFALFSARGGLYKCQKDMKSFFDACQGQEAISISTIHKSKGLEWDETYLGDDVLTSLMKKMEAYAELGELDEAKTEFDEELRLLYVALTRAKVRTVISDDLRSFIESL